MGFLERLSKMFTAKEDSYIHQLNVKCNRCGEVIRARVDIRNDLSIQYDERGKVSYFNRKVLVGDKHCFERIEVKLTFDTNRKLVDRQISGGEFVD